MKQPQNFVDTHGNTFDSRTGGAVEGPQAEINRMLAERPIGTSAYLDPSFQRRLQTLYAQLDRGQPIVGRGGRLT